jgi:hypothetical protein
MVGFDSVDTFRERLEGGLEGFGLFLQGLSGLLPKALQVGRVPSGTHGARIVWGEFLLFDFDFRMVSGD